MCFTINNIIPWRQTIVYKIVMKDRTSNTRGGLIYKSGRNVIAKNENGSHFKPDFINTIGDVSASGIYVYKNLKNAKRYCDTDSEIILKIRVKPSDFIASGNDNTPVATYKKVFVVGVVK